MNWTNYLIHINLYLMLFYAFYLVFLKNETFFTLNRVYLVGSAFFSALIPLIQTQWVKSFFITEKVQDGWQNVNFVMMQGFASPIQEESTWALGDFLTLIYMITVTILIVRLAIKLYSVKRMFSSENHPEAFSFFRKIKVNEDLPQKEQIEKHEQTHAQQLHSADVLFFEILSIINWFNPVVYLYKKSIRQIHEFIADEQALTKAENKKEYALLLFSKSFGINPNQLTNNFFNQSLLKRRIQMIQKPKSRKAAILKYGLSAPLFLLAMILSSATISKNKTINAIGNKIKPTNAIAEILIPKPVENIVIEFKKDKALEKPSASTSIVAGEFDALKMYLAKTIRYPAEAKQNEIMTKIAIEFKVNKNGTIENPKALNQIDNDFSKEAIRSIRTYPEKIAVGEANYTIFFTFKLADSKKPITDETTTLGVIKNYIGEIVITAFSPTNLMIDEVKVDGSGEQPLDNQVFTNVEQLPTFPGGLKEFQKFLSENLKYPAKARENNIQGRVFLHFTVEKDGSLSDIKVVRGIGSGCDEEAVRVLAISPKWNPGKQNGKVVRVSYTIPIFFQMTGVLPNINGNGIKIQGSEFDEKASIMIKQGLYVLDGKIIKVGLKGISEFITSADINSINIIKGEEAVKKYGDKGKYGVVEITSKKKE
nr:TonB family protein [Pseudopedobacter sp.]